MTGGIGPWLPFQMLALGWMGGGAGLLGRATRRLDPRLEVVVLAAYGWVWGFLYGAIMNLWFWPFSRGGSLDWEPGLVVRRDPPALLELLRGDVTRLGRRRRRSRMPQLILVTGLAIMRSLRRFAHRLDPVVELV